MKHLPAILLAFCLSACLHPAPPPEPPLIPVKESRYEILEFDAPGHVSRTYEVTSYTEQNFPRSVSFIHAGRVVTLAGSYQINEYAK